MSPKFPNWLSWFLKLYKKSELPKIPKEIGVTEKICRAIYSPINFRNKKLTRIDPNIFQSPKDKDEVSVNRLNYTTAEFCKDIAKKQENPADRRNYYGFAILNQSDILSLNFTTVYSPIKRPKGKRNLFHSDIKSGYIVKRGKTIPSELSERINALTNKARYYADPDISSAYWKGAALI